MQDLDTTDIVLAALLRCRGHQLSKLIKNGSKSSFQFKNVPIELLNQYDLGQALVEPRLFNHEVRALASACMRGA